MTPLPHEARDGLMRAWLDILRERHPDVTWIAQPNDEAPAVVADATDTVVATV
jgi:hypothetical protein